MKYEEAIFELGGLPIETNKEAEAMGVAVNALRKVQAIENPKPLTLEELKERTGKPIFLVKPNARKYKNYWALQNEATYTTYGYYRFGYTSYHTIFEKLYENDYNKTWLAYDHEPKEAHDGR